MNRQWVLNHWSQSRSTVETWEEIDAESAARWLVKNEHDAPKACAKEYDALEI